MRLELSLGNIGHPAFVAEEVRVAMDVLRKGEAEIRIARLKAGDLEYRALRLHCKEFRYDGARLACPVGRLHHEGGDEPDRPVVPFALEWHAGGRLDFSLTDVDAGALVPLVRRLNAWHPQGRIDVRLRLDASRARIALAARDLSFANRAGDVAGRGMNFSVAADAVRTASGWRWQASGAWPKGEFRFAPWRSAGGLRLQAEGEFSAARIDIRSARLAVEGVGALTASLGWDRIRGEVDAWGLVSERIDLAAAMRAWLQPWLTELGFPEWRTSGQVLFAAEWHSGALQRFYAALEEATLADPTGYLELSGIHAHLPWAPEAPGEAEVRVRAGRLGDLPLGEFALPLRVGGARASIENLVAPMLDGQFFIEHLRLEKVGEDWQAEFSGGIENISMPSLARALRLPRMEGRLNARVPRISYANKLLQMDGALAIEVFDGGITVHQLRMLDPFGRQRRLLVDAVGMGLDLGMLTRTYAFGSIEGRFDIYLRDLELAGWRPVRFAARIESSAGEYLRILSLGALKDIAELGDAAEGKLVRRLPERSIGGFGYSTIGLGCVLADGVCHLSGIAGKDEPHRVQIMAGSGFPSIDIYGYNRRIDWEALVARVRQVVVSRPDGPPE